MDGVEINICGVVLKKGKCVYDFTYASSPANFEGGIEAFDTFIREFRVLEQK